MLTTSTRTLIDFLRLILTLNNFEFDDKNYLQVQGTAIGTAMAPNYANLFMGKVERNLLSQTPQPPLLWCRFIDDIFEIYGLDTLNNFFDF